MSRVLIDDGFTFSFTSKPTDRTPKPVTIKYRTPEPESLARHDRLAFADAKEFAQGQAAFLAENIGEWDATTVEKVGDKEVDKPLPPTKDTFLKVRDWNLLKQFREEICRSNTIVEDEQKK
ncbi:MAG: hypothetical protein U0798_15115 [Gemmataceae bacterium]